MSMSPLPQFRRVAEPTAKTWSVGDDKDATEEVPAYMRQVLALGEANRLSKESRYWTMAFLAMALAVILDFLPYHKISHGVFLALALVFTVQKAISSARAKLRAQKIDRDANAKMGIVEKPKDDEEPEKQVPASFVGPS